MVADFHHEYATTTLSSAMSYGRNRGLTINHKPTSVVAVIEAITLIVIFLGALVANLVALTTTLRDKLLRSNLHNWLILNLIINDLGITITSMTLSIVSVFDHGYILVHNDIMCLINGTGAVGFSLGNIATILAISVDRYLAVVWSTRFPPSKSRTIIFIILCWVIPFINVLPPLLKLLSDLRYHPDTHHCSPVWDACLYYIICFTIIFGITVPVMVFCYTAVVWTLRRQELQLRSFAKDNNLSAATPRGVTAPSSGNIQISADERHTETASSTDAVTRSTDNRETEDYYPSADDDTMETSNAEAVVEMQQNKGHDGGRRSSKMNMKQEKRNHQMMQSNLSKDKRVALTGILLVMTTVVCWAPYCIVHSCFIPIDSNHWMGVVTMWLAYANSLLDPLIYSFMNRRVRARFRTMFSWCPVISWTSVRLPVGQLFPLRQRQHSDVIIFK